MLFVVFPLLLLIFVLCVLIGVFNPFMFKVTIDKYDPFAIYFIVLGSSL